MRTETIDIDDRYGAEYRGKYVFQEITWAKRSRIIQKWTKYHHITGQVISSDFVTIQGETIWASLKEQPTNKPITLEKLLGEEEGLPIALGELFSKVANKLCGITVDEQRFLSEQSEGKNHIQPSSNFDSARNSGSCPARSEENQQKTSRPSS